MLLHLFKPVMSKCFFTKLTSPIYVPELLRDWNFEGQFDLCLIKSHAAITILALLVGGCTAVGWLFVLHCFSRLISSLFFKNELDLYLRE